jgi:hypothetical protein
MWELFRHFQKTFSNGKSDAPAGPGGFWVALNFKVTRLDSCTHLGKFLVRGWGDDLVKEWWNPY